MWFHKNLIETAHTVIRLLKLHISISGSDSEYGDADFQSGRETVGLAALFSGSYMLHRKGGYSDKQYRCILDESCLKHILFSFSS